MSKIIYEDLRLVNYKKAWEYQLKLFAKLLDNKKSNVKNKKHYLLFCEHPHVFTIGKNGDQSNLLINNQLVEDKGIELYNIDRGGDITYHGPGQQVVYPIFDLDLFGINTREYVFRLEEAIIQTLAEFSIQAERLESAAGIWIDAADKSKNRKICAIGVRSSRRITMHGLALNINTDLNYFSYMNPCGFIDRGVTSMEKELGKNIDIEMVKAVMNTKLQSQFELELSKY